MAEKLRTCFVIAPIGPDPSETRNNSDTVFECFIEPALEAVGGFAKPKRSDHINTPGDINKQVVERISKDDLVIADLTERNPNVFYELGIRHTLGKPFVQMIHKDEKIPFDVGQQRTIMFDPKDLRNAKKVISSLKAAIEECMVPGFKPETPLGYSVTLDELEQSDPKAAALKLILEKLDRMEARAPLPVPVEIQAYQHLQSAMPRPHTFNVDAAFSLGRWVASTSGDDLVKLQTTLKALNKALGPEKTAEFLNLAASGLSKETRSQVVTLPNKPKKP